MTFHGSTGPMAWHYTHIPQVEEELVQQLLTHVKLPIPTSGKRFLLESFGELPTLLTHRHIPLPHHLCRWGVRPFVRPPTCHSRTHNTGYN